MSRFARLFGLCFAVPLLLAFSVGCGSGSDVTTTREESSDNGQSGASSVPEATNTAATGNGEKSGGGRHAEAGSGGGNTQSSGNTEGGGNSAHAQETQTAKTGNQATPSGGHAAAGSTANNSNTSGSANQANTSLKLPADVAKWTPDDFRKAAQARDRRLIQAIERLGAASPGDPNVAALLTQLLVLVGQPQAGNAASNTDGGTAQPSQSSSPKGAASPHAQEASQGAQPKRSPSPKGASSPHAQEASGKAETTSSSYSSQAYTSDSSGGGDAKPIVEAIVRALARNGSPQAWQTLTRVLGGQIRTVVDDDTMAEWILSAALENYAGADHPTHRLLTTAIQTPGQLNPRRGAEFGRQVNRILAGMAASVVDQLMGVPPDADVPRPANPSGQDESDYRTYSTSGSTAGGDAGETTEGGNPQAAAVPRLNINTRPLDDAAARRAIQFLWRPETVTIIQSRTHDIGGFEENVELLALAGSLPLAGVREATFDLFNGRWEEGAGPRQQQLYQSVVRDPGLIVVLKMLPRLQPRGPVSGAAATNNPRLARSIKESQAKYTWMATSAYMLRAVTVRLAAASQRAGRSNLDEDKLPIKLHKGRKILGSYEINWPADLGQAASGSIAPASLTVQYVRMEIDGDAAKTYQSYKQQLKRAKEYSFSQGKWLDYTSVGSAAGTRRSIDVVFAAAPAANPGGNVGREEGGGASQQTVPAGYVADILIVEIPNPRLKRDR